MTSRIDIIGLNGNNGDHYDTDDVGIPDHMRGMSNMDTYIYKNGETLFECVAPDEDAAREQLGIACEAAEGLGFEFANDVWDIAYVY